jgi:hypothetical protein
MSNQTHRLVSISIALALFVLIYAMPVPAIGQDGNKSISSLKFIGQYTFPHNRYFRNTVVGGLSGIDYDRANDQYYLVCDDRSERNVARYYSARIPVSEKGIDTVMFSDFKPLLDSTGRAYPGVRENRWRTPDPESIRYNGATGEVVWSSEGEREIFQKDTVLIDPVIQVIGTDNKYKSSYRLPGNLRMQATESGPRQNGVLESLAFTDDFASLYTCLEEPLYQDGPRPSTVETKSWVRIYKFDAKSQVNTAQYAYKLEKVAYPASPPTAFKVNGVSEILYLAPDKLLTVERSYSTGSFAFVIKVFIADLSKAENIAGNSSLIKTPPRQAAIKKLILDMSKLNVFVDNIEGVTFGPTLLNGHQTLIFVADNNFKSLERNQFLLFEVIP